MVIKKQKKREKEKKMIKGVNKRIVMLRLEGNRFYESACFVVRRDVERKREEEKDMLKEANRILSEMEINGRRKRGRARRALLWVLTLAVGIVLGVVAAQFFHSFLK